MLSKTLLQLNLTLVQDFPPNEISKLLIIIIYLMVVYLKNKPSDTVAIGGLQIILILFI